METMNTCTANEMKTPAVVCICLDEEESERLSMDLGESVIAYKNKTFGIGIYISESLSVGVYGDDFLRSMAISAYWDENEEEISNAIAEAETMDALISAAHAVILGCIADIMAS